MNDTFNGLKSAVWQNILRVCLPGEITFSLLWNKKEKSKFTYIDTVHER